MANAGQDGGASLLATWFGAPCSSVRQSSDAAIGYTERSADIDGLQLAESDQAPNGRDRRIQPFRDMQWAMKADLTGVRSMLTVAVQECSGHRGSCSVTA